MKSLLPIALCLSVLPTLAYGQDKREINPEWEKLMRASDPDYESDKQSTKPVIVITSITDSGQVFWRRPNWQDDDRLLEVARQTMAKAKSKTELVEFLTKAGFKVRVLGER